MLFSRFRSAMPLVMSVRRCQTFVRKDPPPPTKTPAELSVYFMAPFLAAYYLYCLYKEGEHTRHLYEHGTVLPEMDYTQMRTGHGRFPWGDGKTPLFGYPSFRVPKE